MAFKDAAVTYMPYVEQTPGEGTVILSRLVSRACLLVTDDYPAFEIPRWISTVAPQSRFRVEAVDSNGLYPMRATSRIFLTASSFRRFHEKQTSPIFPEADPLAGLDLPRLRKLPNIALRLTVPPCISASVAAVTQVRGGSAAARERLRAFLSSDASPSGLSPYLHFGHISAHEVHHAVASSRQPHRERFLDQLTTWRELGFNMCALSSDYDKYDSLPEWARATLRKHAQDPRPVCYSAEQLEAAETHDALWNSAQARLVSEGQIPNRLRMLWGKKILEWSATPQEALASMIQLNNKYALDGRDPNSYTGIFWTLGRYDRPWGPERPIFGLIRYMSSENTARKLRREQ
jgi:deoxyribodipyrimidine photo-lyase